MCCGKEMYPDNIGFVGINEDKTENASSLLILWTFWCVQTAQKTHFTDIETNKLALNPIGICVGAFICARGPVGLERHPYFASYG